MSTESGRQPGFNPEAVHIVAVEFNLPENHSAVNTILSLQMKNAELRGRLEDTQNELNQAYQQLEAVNQKLEVSRYDGMTGLLRRDAFLELADKKRAATHEALIRGKPGHDTAFMVIPDLRKLHSINNKKGGQSAGDKVISDVGNAFRDLSSEDEGIDVTPARLGGDEFALLVTCDSRHYQVEAVIEKIFLMLNTIAVELTPFGLNIGAASISTPDKNITDMLREADPKAPRTRAQKIGRFVINTKYLIKRQFVQN